SDQVTGSAGVSEASHTALATNPDSDSTNRISLAVRAWTSSLRMRPKRCSLSFCRQMSARRLREKFRRQCAARDAPKADASRRPARTVNRVGDKALLETDRDQQS